MNGKTAIITGSTSGIGKGIATRFAKSGYNIVLNGFGPHDEIEQLKTLLNRNFNVEVAYHDADLTDVSAIENLIHTTIETFSSIDVVVNNAGMQYVAPIDEFPAEKWDQIIALNLSAAFHTIRLATPHLKKAGWGRIVNIASAHAHVASPFKAAYVAAKHGIAGLTKVVSLELAEQNITCNAICPGYVWTPLVENQVADTAKARGISEDEVKNNVLLAAQPTKKFTTIEDVANLAHYLCTDDAANITGSMMNIDGGWTAQ